MTLRDSAGQLCSPSHIDSDHVTIRTVCQCEGESDWRRLRTRVRRDQSRYRIAAWIDGYCRRLHAPSTRRHTLSRRGKLPFKFAGPDLGSLPAVRHCPFAEAMRASSQSPDGPAVASRQALRAFFGSNVGTAFRACAGRGSDPGPCRTGTDTCVIKIAVLLHGSPWKWMAWGPIIPILIPISEHGS